VGSIQSPIQWIPGVKRLGREADHSPPSSAEINAWSYTSTHTYEGGSKSFRTESILKPTITTTDTRWEAKQRIMTAKHIRLTHKIVIKLYPVAEKVLSWGWLYINTTFRNWTYLLGCIVLYICRIILLTYLLTYLLTPWCRKLFEKLIITQLVKNILLSYATRRFITVFTKAHYWTLSWASWIQFAPSIPISLRSSLVLSSHLRLGLPSGLLPSGRRIILRDIFEKLYKILSEYAIRTLNPCAYSFPCFADWIPFQTV
jgi:hypothetical protein